MPRKTSLVPAVPPKTLTLVQVAAYLGLGSSQAADRWLKAHRVLTFVDRLGYRRAWLREIDAACFTLTAERIEESRKRSA